MITAETMAQLEGRGLPYIPGVRERSDKLVRELVVNNRRPFVPVVTTGDCEVEDETKTPRLARRHYIVCRNHARAATDAADRASILAALEQRLARYDIALVGHPGYRRYVKAIRSVQFATDPDKGRSGREFRWHLCAAHEHRPQNHAMLCYEQLWSTKQALLAARHSFRRGRLSTRDGTIRG
jgi:hypothetical protein